MHFSLKQIVDLIVMSWIGNVYDIEILLDDWDYFFGICVNFGNFFLVDKWLLLGVKIIGIVGKLRNCGIISNLLICEFLRICWNIFGNFIVEKQLYLCIRIMGIVGKLWNCGKIHNLLICGFLRICWNIFLVL